MDIISTTEVARIARVAAGRASTRLEVVGATINAGGSAYAEILLEIRGCHTDSCQLVLGVFRNVTAAALEADIVAQLQQHVAAHETHPMPGE